MAAAFQILAAMAVPLTVAPSLRIAPPPTNPMPVINPRTTRD